MLDRHLARVTAVFSWASKNTAKNTGKHAEHSLRYKTPLTSACTLTLAFNLAASK